MMTLTEVQNEQRSIIYQLRTIESDRDRDPIRMATEHNREMAPLLRRLERLRYRRENASMLIAEYLERIKRIQRELKLVAQTARIEKLRKLVEKINKLRRGPKTQLLMSRLRLGNSRAIDFTFLISGYEIEIRALERLRDDDTFFAKEERKLLIAIEAETRRWDQFAENRLAGAIRIEQLLARQGDLAAIERDMRGNQNLKKLEEFQRRWLEATAGMSSAEVDQILEATKGAE